MLSEINVSLKIAYDFQIIYFSSCLVHNTTQLTCIFDLLFSLYNAVQPLSHVP